MTSVEQTADQSRRELRSRFFDYLFSDHHGKLCIASSDRDKGNFQQRFFDWPHQREDVSIYVDRNFSNRNIWFCVNLLSRAERRKENACPSSFAWADLDEVDPLACDPPPTLLVESSPGRYQGYWRIAGEPLPAEVAEDFSKRLAYKIGADKSGWDITQLLRVPFTLNHKYEPSVDVKLAAIVDTTYESNYLDTLPVPTLGPKGTVVVDPHPVPDVSDISLEDLLIRNQTNEEFIRLYSRTPQVAEDWSRILWRFINLCLTLDLSDKETFVVCLSAACNKYARDNRPAGYLWRDITKAAQEHATYTTILTGSFVEVLKMPHLVDWDDFEEDALISDYKLWAANATDAPEQYHELTCFIALSAVICSGLYLRVEWGEIIPNLWGLVLGESTLTRKTTAMRLAVDMLKDIDDSLILATDGSAEGLLTGLSNRPHRVSIFWKDEVSGLFDSINRKDYLAGLPETLTQLYDVPKVLTRLLRKETITISEPYFIFFGGGIRDKVYSLINDEYILSGFLPRFLVVSGENDISRLRRTGPPTVVSTERKDGIVRGFTDLRDRYNSTVQTFIAGQPVEMSRRVEARLTDDAWAYYGNIEEVFTQTGYESDISLMALPTLTRLAFSLLKMSLLVAASRREPSPADILTVEVADVKQAAFYIEKWGKHSIDLLVNAGHSTTEKQLGRAMILIRKHPEGITKGELMQRLHLGAREARELVDTLRERGVIGVQTVGRGVRLYAL